MKIETNIDLQYYKKGLRALILLLYVFSFSGYTGYIHTPQTTPAKTEQLGDFTYQVETSIKSYKQIVHSFYKSGFQMFNLEFLAYIHHVLECLQFKTYPKEKAAILSLFKMGLMAHQPLGNTEVPHSLSSI